jgi:hypothetical protein
LAKGRSSLVTLIFLILPLLLCTLVDPVRASGADEPTTAEVREFGQNCLADTKYLLASPAEWGRAEWSQAALAAGTALILYGADQKLRELFQKNRSAWGDDLAKILDKAGNVVYLAPAVGLWYFYGKRNGNSKSQEAALCALESLLITGGMTTVLKLSAHRSRPYTEAGSRSFDGPGWSLDDDYLSFCSLHSAAAFSVATVVADYYRDQGPTPFLAYGAATLVALSRLNDDQHWSSDVFCGAALGYYTAKQILARRRSKTREDSGAALSLEPLATRNGPALALRYRF